MGDAVLINDISAEKQNDIIKFCYSENKRIYIAPKISDIILKSSENLNLVDTPLYLCRNDPMKPRQRVMKRAFDLVVSVLSIIFLSPIFLITAIAIKLDDHGPIFFWQERVTRNNERFVVYKFCSMKKAFDFAQYGIRINQIGTIVASIKHQFHGFFLSDRLIAAP